MSKILLILLSVFFTSILYASGTYAPRTRSSYSHPNLKTLPSGVTKQSDSFVSNGYKRSLWAIKSAIYEIPRNGVAIHKIYLKGSKYIIEGVYETLNELQKFIKKLKYPENLNKNIKVLKKSKRFAGVKTRYYQITSDNLW